MQGSGGEHDHEVVAAAVFEPMGGFLVDPFGLGGLGTEHDDEVAGAVEGVADLGPQVRADFEVGVVAEYTQRAQLAPAASDTVQPLLQRGDDGSVTVGVGHERVEGVGHIRRRDRLSNS